MKHRSFQHEVQRAAALLAVLAATGLAHAQPGPRREARLHLATPASCVTENGIAAGVQQRSDTIVFVARDDVPVLEVAVAERGRELQAELSVRWPDGRSARRSLAATSCQQLTAAVALVISMTLDPAGETQGVARGAAAPRTGDRRGGSAPRAGGAPPVRAPTPADSRSDEVAPAPAPDEATDASEPEAASSGNVALPEARPSPASGTPTKPAADGGATTLASPAADGGEEPFFQLDEWSLGAAATLAFAIAPRALPGIGAYLWLAWHGAPPFSPALRLDLGHAWLDDFAAVGGKASFTLDSAALKLCPLALRAGPFAGYACADAQLGLLSAQGTDTYRPATRTRLWSAFGGALLASARITSWAEVQLGSSLRAPARRDRFAFAPDVFHRVGWLTLELHASLGVRFP